MISYFTIEKMFLLALTVLPVHGSKKYDVEAEARKIYGADLNSVLQKFRHSPEYLKILEERADQITNQLSAIYQQLVFYYQNELKSHVVKLLKPGEDVNKVKNRLLLRSKYNPLRSYLRQGEELEAEGENKEAEESTMSPSDILDEYVAKRKKLSASYINHFRGIGFEYFGRVLHGLIKNLGGELNGGGKFTQHGLSSKTTTEHVAIHTVSTSADMTLLTVSPFEGENEATTSPVDNTTEIAETNVSTKKPGKAKSRRWSGGRESVSGGFFV